jgi:uncharacterized membrane protein YjgN (DUF898 family)
MTIVDDRAGVAAAVTPPLQPVPSSPVRIRLGFKAHAGDFRRLMVRGAVLQAITLGIYRFWLFTDMRRFLWAATRIGDDAADYTGTAAELLIGFLIAIGILTPVYALFFVASLELGLLSDLSSVAAFVLLAGFGQYAAYRARRYRLTRTVFRGLRFHQTGSAAGYAFRVLLWWIPVILTLGLAWPWALASLERYKMRNTFYGHLGGSFAGSGMLLFARGFLPWLLTVGILVAGMVTSAANTDWQGLGDAVKGAGGDAETFLILLAAQAYDDRGLVLLIATPLASALIVALLYPAFQAMVMRWWIGGLRLGGATAASDLRFRRYYGAYLWYLLYVVLFIVAFSAAVYLAAQLGFMMPSNRIDFSETSLVREGALVAAYVVFMLGIHAVYHVVLKLRLWRAAVESMQISDYAAFDHVHADAAASSALGEGLADALGTGGI